MRRQTAISSPVYALKPHELYPVKIPKTLALLVCIAAIRLPAQNVTFSVLHQFSWHGSYNVNGPPAQGIDGALYGTTYTGGGTNAYGTIFKVDTNGNLTILYTFTPLQFFSTFDNGINSDGAYPLAGLTLSSNTLYGTASGGGTNGEGTVFSINTDGSDFTNLYSFTGGSDGGKPSAGLILAENTLYGTTEFGGLGSNGIVFALNSDGTEFRTLHSFSPGSNIFSTLSANPMYTNSDGAYPIGELVLSGNTLYGTTSGGGTNSTGTVFAVNTGGKGFVNLHTFGYPSPEFTNRFSPYFTNGDGAKPSAGLILAGDTLYGTTYKGGTNANGTVYSVNTDGTDFSTLFTFAPGGAVYGSQASLILSGNTLYGTQTAGGTNGWGLIFALNTQTVDFTPLYSFNGAGANPGGMILSGTALYGTTQGGLVYHINVNGSGYSVIYNFQNSDGVLPVAPLVLSGNTLYGTAAGSGANGNGTVFSVVTDGSDFTTLYDFGGGLDGGFPEGGLVVSGDTLYGTTTEGGSNNYGTLFSMSTDGADFSVLHNFTATNGGSPQGPLLLSGSTLYGTAQNGATVFATSTNGSGFTNLSRFMGSPGSSSPFDGLILAGGTLYGTAERAGDSANGTVFALNSAGITNLHTFTTLFDQTNTDGAFPEAGLILSGNTLYGTTSEGGTNGYGTVFAVNTNGSGFTTLYSFADGDDGADPAGGLVLSGNTLYGTTQVGGSFDYGTVFGLNTDGTGFNTLYSFTGGIDGSDPQAGLVLFGNVLYGTASQGGENGSGTVFSLTLAQGPPLDISLSGANVILTWPANASGYNLESTTNLTPPTVWSAVSPRPTVVDGQYIVTNAIAGTQQFFRLNSN